MCSGVKYDESIAQISLLTAQPQSFIIDVVVW